MAGTKESRRGDLRFWSSLPSMYMLCSLNTVQVFHQAHPLTFQYVCELNRLQAWKKTGYFSLHHSQISCSRSFISQWKLRFRIVPTILDAYSDVHQLWSSYFHFCAQTTNGILIISGLDYMALKSIHM
jgi:hypothetical protein